MRRINKSVEVSTYASDLYKEGKTIGFVPTMGALHQGHIELIKRAKQQNDIVVCSIFVNPLQFNRQEDLDSYPDRLKEDTSLLEDASCDILFTPSKEDLYPTKQKLDYDFGSIAIGMEADHRPNHFEGVAAVISRFFEIMNPTKAYFGEKDYQQLAIVRWLTNEYDFSTEIVACPTVRNSEGLALSSRNYLLSKEGLELAAEIYQVQLYCKANMKHYNPKELAKRCFIKLEKNFEPEYVVFVDEISLKTIDKWSDSKYPRVFVAAYLSGVRLIDNISLNP